MAEIDSTEAMRNRVILDAGTTVEEVGTLLSSYVDLMLDVALQGSKNRDEQIYALLVATQTQVERLTEIPNVLIDACGKLSPTESPAQA